MSAFADLFRRYPVITTISLTLFLGVGIKIMGLFMIDPVSLLVIPGILICVVFLGLLLKRLKVIIFFVVLYAPFELLAYKFLPEPLGTTSRYATEAILIVAMLALIGDRLFTGKRWKRTPLDLPMMLFMSAAILSAIVNAVSPVVALLGMRILLRYVLLYYLIIQIGFEYSAIRRLITGIIATALVVAGLGLAQSIIGEPITAFLTVPETTLGEATLRNISSVQGARGTYIYSTLGRYDLFGLYTAIILLFLLALYIYHPRYRARLIFIGIPIGICLILTFSRQSWLMLYVGLVAWIMALKNVKLGMILALAPLLLTVIAMLLPQMVRYFSVSELGEVSVLERLLEIYSPRYVEVSANSGGRLFVIQQVGPRILEKAPLLGFGPGQFGSLTSELFGFSAAAFLAMPENQLRLVNDVNWITILGQYGLLGSVAFLMMYTACLHFAWKVHKRSFNPLTKSISLACIGSIVGLLIAGFFGPNFEQRTISMYVWLLAGLTVVLARNEKASIQKPTIRKTNSDN